MDGGLSSAFTATLRISQIAYEFKAVGEQTRDLLDSTNHIQTTMQTIRTLRRQKSMHLEKAEKGWIDNVLVNTEKTLSNVAMLIEPARVDMQTKFGSVSLMNRGIFVFRDSPKVATNLSRLNLASQSLNTVMNILCTRDGQAPTKTNEKSPISPVESFKSVLSLPSDMVKQPPTYDESEFLNRRRSRSSKIAALVERPVTRMEVVEEPPSQSPLEGFDDGLIAIAPAVHVTEFAPTPSSAHKQNPFEGADGLQVCGTGFGEPHNVRPSSSWSSNLTSPLFSQNQSPNPTWQPQQQFVDRRQSQYQAWHGDPTYKHGEPAFRHGDQAHRQSSASSPSLDGTQYQCWHGDTVAPQSRASFQSSDSQVQEIAPDPGARFSSSTFNAILQTPSRLSHSSSTFDLRSASNEATGSNTQGRSRPAGRSQRRAWLEFQSHR